MFLFIKGTQETTNQNNVLSTRKARQLWFEEDILHGITSIEQRTSSYVITVSHGEIKITNFIFSLNALNFSDILKDASAGNIRITLNTKLESRKLIKAKETILVSKTYLFLTPL